MFLIVWHESGDEIHFILMSMNQFEAVKNADPATMNMEDLNLFIGEIRDLAIETKFLQTYCYEEWFSSNYQIKYIIHLPEFGM